MGNHFRMEKVYVLRKREMGRERTLRRQILTKIEEEKTNNNKNTKVDFRPCAYKDTKHLCG